MCRMRLFVDYDIDPSGKTCYVENVGHVDMLYCERLMNLKKTKLKRSKELFWHRLPKRKRYCKYSC